MEENLLISRIVASYMQQLFLPNYSNFSLGYLDLIPFSCVSSLPTSITQMMQVHCKTLYINKNSINYMLEKPHKQIIILKGTYMKLLHVLCEDF